MTFPDVRQDSGQSHQGQATIIAAHADAHLGLVVAALRERGYVVHESSPADAPEQVRALRPAAMVIDASLTESVQSIQTIRQAPWGASFDILVVGLPESEASDPARALGTAFFDGAVEPEVIVGAMDALLRGHDQSPQASHDPEEPAVSSRELPMSIPVMHLMTSSSLPPQPGSSQPPSPSADGSPWARGPLAGPTAMSPELEQLLREAERRMTAEPGGASDVPTPDEEVNAILPAEVLAALDEPLDEARESVPREPSREGTQSSAAGLTGQQTNATRGGATGVRGDSTAGIRRETSAGVVRHETSAGAPDEGRQLTTGSRQLTTGSHGLEEAAEQELDDALSDAELTPAPPTPRRPPSPRMEPEALPDRDKPTSAPPPPTIARPGWQFPRDHVASMPQALPSLQSDDPTPSPAPVVLQPEAASAFAPGLALPEVLTDKFDGLRVLATCIASRATVSLCFEDRGVLRRAILKDGDFVTCASSAPEESLVGYLVARGDLAREAGIRLGTRLPPFGRHAAAALIAHGHLGQDQLWPMLRAHAEWLLGQMALTQSGVCTIESEPPGRLRAEPSVFGGAAGAEVLVEVTLRVLQPDDALARLGGTRAKLAEGAHKVLLSECALAESDRALVEDVAGRSVGEVLREAGGPELAPMLLALVALGVFELLAAVGRDDPSQEPGPDPLDAESVRARVKARMALVLEGDYFELLGVARNATSYELRRAYLEMRRAYDPGRLLTAATADLADDVRTIVEVIEEAWEALRDPGRRERYRTALEAHPPT